MFGGLSSQYKGRYHNTCYSYYYYHYYYEPQTNKQTREKLHNEQSCVLIVNCLWYDHKWQPWQSDCPIFSCFLKVKTLDSDLTAGTY